MNKKRIGIIRSAYRPDIVSLLAKGAIAVLREAGVSYEEIEVSGSLEIPAAVAFVQADRKRRFDGIVVLGCLMKGATIYDEVIAYTIFPALDQIAREQLLPLGNGVLTVASEAQALERADPAQQDRGGEAAKACLAMLKLKMVGK